MWRMFSFKCNSCSEVFEDLVQHTETVTECKKCGEQADKTITPVHFKLDGTDPSFGKEYIRWERKMQRRQSKRNA